MGSESTEGSSFSTDFGLCFLGLVLGLGWGCSCSSLISCCFLLRYSCFINSLLFFSSSFLSRSSSAFLLELNKKQGFKHELQERVTKHLFIIFIFMEDDTSKVVNTWPHLFSAHFQPPAVACGAELPLPSSVVSGETLLAFWPIHPLLFARPAGINNKISRKSKTSKTHIVFVYLVVAFIVLRVLLSGVLATKWEWERCHSLILCQEVFF